MNSKHTKSGAAYNHFHKYTWRDKKLALTTMSSWSKNHHHFLSVEMATGHSAFSAGAISTTRICVSARNRSMLWQPICRTLSTGHFSDHNIACQQRIFVFRFLSVDRLSHTVSILSSVISKYSHLLFEWPLDFLTHGHIIRRLQYNWTFYFPWQLHFSMTMHNIKLV